MTNCVAHDNHIYRFRHGQDIDDDFLFINKYDKIYGNECLCLGKSIGFVNSHEFVMRSRTFFDIIKINVLKVVHRYT